MKYTGNQGNQRGCFSSHSHSSTVSFSSQQQQGYLSILSLTSKAPLSTAPGTAIPRLLKASSLASHCHSLKLYTSATSSALCPLTPATARLHSSVFSPKVPPSPALRSTFSLSRSAFEGWLYREYSMRRLREGREEGVRTMRRSSRTWWRKSFPARMGGWLSNSLNICVWMAGRCSGKLVSARFSSHLALATTYSFRTVFASGGESRAATRLTSLHIRLQALASCWPWNCCSYCFSMSAQSCSSNSSNTAGLYACSPIILASNWSTRTLDLLLVGYSSAEYSLPPSLKKTVSPSWTALVWVLGILGMLVYGEGGRQLWRTLLAIYSGTVSFEAARRTQAGSRKSKQQKSLSPSSCLNSPKHSFSRLPSKMLLQTCSPTKKHYPRTSRITRSCSFWLKVLSLIFFIYPDRSAQGFLLSRRAFRVALWSCWTEALGNRALSLSTRRRKQPERGMERRLAIVVQFQAIIDSNWLFPPSRLQPTVLPLS